MREDINGLSICSKILFNKGSFTIALFDYIGDDGDNFSYSLKGNYFAKEGNKYVVSAEYAHDKTYKDSYNAVSVTCDIDFSKASSKELAEFFESIISKNLAKEIINTLDDPIKSLEEENIEELVSVKGIGVSKAEKLIQAFQSQKDYAPAMAAFSKYELTPKAVKAIVNHFGSVEKAIEIVGDNPYAVVDVKGFGFRKADQMFLNDDRNKPSDIRRVRAFTDYIFTEDFSNGNTWMSPRDFINAFTEAIPSADPHDAIDYINTSDKYTVLTTEDEENPKKLMLTKSLALELVAVYHLMRINSAKNTMVLDNKDDIIANVEEAQGWKYTPEQRASTEQMFKNNVFMVQGLAGTGKSSVVNAFLSVVSQNGYSYAQCALSGKAASNLTAITGKKGGTIHSLLSFSPEKGGFEFDEKTKLPYNVIVLDEISMVNLEIFVCLVAAIRDGSSLIMLGDYGQLDSIGVGVMGGMIRSRVVGMSLLKQIHRQASKSAMITHSISFRNGVIPEDLKMKDNTMNTYGEKQDLKYIFLSKENEKNMLMATISQYKEMIEIYGVDDVQILASTKTTGNASVYDLNTEAQKAANPISESDSCLELGYGDYKYKIKAGDRVLNTVNTRDTMSPSGVKTPIYNGNTGSVVSVDPEDDSMVINFDSIGEVVVTNSNLNNIELGYAMTVHKSQGSTIKCVIFAMPFHYLLNTRELVYTGCTRASERQILITSPSTLRAAIKKTSSKKYKTTLAYFLGKIFNKEDISGCVGRYDHTKLERKILNV